MQCGMRDVQWEEERRLQISHQWVADEMGEPDGVLMVDESGYRKKGQDSAGVARQYCGALGKVDNCQVGVFAASASRHGDALVDTRLCLPDPWCSEAYAPQRTKCAVPRDRDVQTKPPLAAEMVRTLYPAQVLPFRSIMADCLYGNRPDFWAAYEACVGTIACVAVPEEIRCWLQPLATQTVTSRYRGEDRRQREVVTPGNVPQTVAALAQQIPPTFWSRRPVSEGTKGPIT